MTKFFKKLFKKLTTSAIACSDLYDRIKLLGPRLSPNALPDFEYVRTEFLRRDVYTKICGRCVPTKETIDVLSEFIDTQTVLSIGAGLGLIERLLKDRGHNVVATDLYDPKFCDTEGDAYMEVEELEAAAAVKKYPTDILLIVWPPYDDPMAYNALKEFRGDVVIYIGESYGGCTADEEFHQLLDVEFEEASIDVPLKQWWGIHDCVFIYKRRIKNVVPVHNRI